MHETACLPQRPVRNDYGAATGKVRPFRRSRYPFFAAAILCLLAPEMMAQGIITTVAGTEWVFAGDGKPALDAPLGNINAVTTDRSGNPVVADPGNEVVVRLNPNGLITVLAGNGLRGYSGDGDLATNAALRSPQSATFDGRGNLYIADTDNNRIRMVTPDGTITTVAGNGSAGFSGDGGPATNASLNSPLVIIADFSGTLYISDGHNNRVRRVSPDGTISTWAGNGQTVFAGENVPATRAALNDVEDMALDSKGNLYLADFGNNRIRKVDPNGIITTVAGDGVARYFGDGGPAVMASLSGPGGIAVDAIGNLYVSDTNNFRIRKISAQGVISTIAGTGSAGFSGDGGVATRATFAALFGLTLDAAGNLYVADRDNYRIRKINTLGIVSTVAGNARFRFFADGTAAANSFLFEPFGICFDAAGNLYIADTFNNRVRKVAPSGMISTIAGNGGSGYTGDGGPGTQAALFTPYAVAADKFGNIYIADADNALIRKVAANGIISTVAGNPNANPGYSGDGGKATQATLNVPVHVALDNAGNLYIADYGNNRIRRVTTDGIISTFAGTGKAGFSGDGGPALAATLNGPSALAFDGAGNLYVADSLNARVRRITTDGMINTFAGGGFRTDTAADSFPATQATLGSTLGIVVDSAANVYFSDGRKNRVRKVSSSGIISTIAGNGGMAFSGDGGLSTDASLASPYGLAVDPSGNLLIADSLNNRIRTVLALPATLQFSPASLSFSAKSGGGLTDAQGIAISSSVPSLLYSATATTANGGDWLKVDAPSGSAPAVIQVVADPTGLSPGAYSGTIAISSPSTGARPPVAVSFVVTQADNPKLGAGSDALTFSLVQGAPASTQTVTVTNLGSGSATFAVSVATDSGGTWLTASPATGTATPILPGTITLQADPGNLDPGTYTGTLTVGSDAAGTLVIPVTMTVSSITKKLLLSQTGLAFTAVSHGGAPLPQNFGVLNLGQGTLDWTVQTSTLSGGDDWLIVNQTSGSSTAGASTAPLIDVAVSANLAPGEYYGKIQVFSEAADNSPRTVMVVLNVLDPSNDPGPDVRPTGLIFSGDAGSSPGSQSIFVSNLGTGVATYASSRITLDGQNWFLNAPTNATVTANQPSRIVVQPDFTGLAPGIYNGALTLLFNGGITRTVNILSVVTGNAATVTAKPLKTGAERDATGSCTSLQIQFVSPAANFALPATKPISLSVRVTDNCGAPLLKGIVTARFSNGDPDLSLISSGGGVWSNTWQPRSANPPQVSIGVTALDLIRALGGQSGSFGNPFLSGSLQASGPSATPVVNSGVLNAASFVKNPLVAPGGLITVFGLQLADACDSNPTPPYGMQLGNTQVFLDNKPLALLFACKALTDPQQPLDQINAQVPYDLAVNTSHQLAVQRGVALSPAVDVGVASAQPGIFTKSQNGMGQGEIFVVGSDGSRTLAEPGTPASAGDTVIILCSSLGGVSPSVGLGLPAPVSPIAQTMNPVLVSIGGLSAQVLSAALEPDVAGRYQVQVVVPLGVTPGDEVPVALTVSGQNSPPVTMAIK